MAQLPASFGGPERRRNRMFITANTEYHLHDDVCVAVRDRRSLAWIEDHRAIGARLLGAFSLSPQGGLVPETRPAAGHHLVFLLRGRDVVTSGVVSIDRPPKEAISHYQLVAA